MDASMLLASGQYFNFMSPAGFRFDVEVIAHVTCPLQPYQSVGERSRGLQVN